MQPLEPMRRTLDLQWEELKSTMAAATVKNYECKMLSFYIFQRQTMAFKSLWTLAVILFAPSQCFADDDHHEMEEFLKREYSLSKPYQGRYIVTPV